MIQQILTFIVLALLLGNHIGLKYASVEDSLRDVTDSYGEITMDNPAFTEETGMDIILKGIFMVVAGMVILTVKELEGLDVSPILLIILAFLVLPMFHFFGLLWVLLEEVQKRVTKKNSNTNKWTKSDIS